MIPVVINNRNRLTTLKKLTSWLQGLDVEIIVLDNDSSYPPLLDFYKTAPFRVVCLERNLGHTALYQWGEHLSFPTRYFIYTDSDIVPREDCPKDLIEYLLKARVCHQSINKIGLGLEINDLPDCYRFKNEVLAAEQEFWRKKYGDYFVADIDTTFALYDKENVASKQHCLENCLRTDYPYIARHLPWYVDSNNLDAEERYYISHANAVWTGYGATRNGRVGKWTQKARTQMLRKIFE